MRPRISIHGYTKAFRMTRGERWYRRLLRLYSPEMRESSSDEMISTYRSMIRRASGLARVTLWFRLSLDLLLTALPDRYEARQRRRRNAPPSSRARLMESLRQDLSYAFRVLRKSPVFTVVAALTVAIGVGATTTVFSVTNGLLYRKLPGVDRPGELITAHRQSDEGNDFGAFSYPNFVDYRSDGAEFIDLAALSTLPASVGGETLAEESHAKPIFALTVTHNYFRVLGARTLLGRFFTEEEAETVGRADVVVLTHRTWTRRFDADSAIVGQTIRVNRHPFTVIGVTPEGFNGHDGTAAIGMFLPMTVKAVFEDERRMTDRGATWMETVGRLKPNVSLKQAQAGLGVIADRLETDFPDDNTGQGIRLLGYFPIFAAAAGPIKIFMLLLFGVAAIVLMIGSVNVAAMMLARAGERAKEIGVRMALGAGRRRLVRQLLTESIVLFALGGTGGLALSYLATSLINKMQPPIPIPLALDVSPDLRVLVLSLGLILTTGLVFGLAPALQGTRQPLTAVIHGGSGSHRRSRLRSVFVVAQVAGSTLLLVGSGLFLRGLQQADLIDPGLNPDGVHALGLSLRMHNYSEEEATDLYRNLVERATASPGVASVGLIDNLPLSMGNQTTVFVIPGREPVPGDGAQRTDFSVVSPGYFTTMQIPLVRGRGFTEADSENSPAVVIINEEIARKIWPGQDPIGKQLLYGRLENGEPVEIVGVAKDGSYRMLGEEQRFMMFRPYAQERPMDMTLVARADPAIGRELAPLVWQLDPDLPLEWNSPMKEIMGLSLLPSRIVAVVATAFGSVGLLLAALGLYGILSQMVTQRTREIGVRIALGAGRERVRRLFLGHGMRLTLTGLVIGFAAAFGITRFLGFFLYGLSPTDPATFGGIGLLLALTALAACYIPAHRATRTEPMEALRHE